MASKRQSSSSSRSRRPKPMVPKTGVKPKSMGGGRYGCGGKLK